MDKYRVLSTEDVLQEGDERAYYASEGLGGADIVWETIPPWMIGKQAKGGVEEGFRRPRSADVVEAAVRLLKAVEYRMPNVYPVAEEMRKLHEAVYGKSSSCEK